MFAAAARAAWAHILTPDILDSFSGTQSAGETLVAELDGELVGFVSILGCEVDRLYTEPRVWGLGTGRALLDAGLRRLAARGCSEAMLWTEERNERPRAFYERYGWQPDGGRRERDYRGVPLVELRYRIAL